jgi:hypothetical protein
MPGWRWRSPPPGLVALLVCWHCKHRQQFSNPPLASSRSAGPRLPHRHSRHYHSLHGPPWPQSIHASVLRQDAPGHDKRAAMLCHPAAAVMIWFRLPRACPTSGSTCPWMPFQTGAAACKSSGWVVPPTHPPPDCQHTCNQPCVHVDLRHVPTSAFPTCKPCFFSGISAEHEKGMRFHRSPDVQLRCPCINRLQRIHVLGSAMQWMPRFISSKRPESDGAVMQAKLRCAGGRAGREGLRRKTVWQRSACGDM